MNKRSGTSKEAADKLVRGIKRKTRKHYSAEEKIRSVRYRLANVLISVCWIAIQQQLIRWSCAMLNRWELC